MKTNKPTTNSPATIDTAKLDAVLGGCGCGNPNCQLQDLRSNRPVNQQQQQ